MPIYEYECPKCGRFDVLQKMSAKPLEKHDVCGSKVRKLMSAGSFSFKGSGFYITDYKGRNAPPASKKGESKSKAESKAEPKSDAKASPCATCPASKPTGKSAA